LRARLVAVEKDGYRRPVRADFGTFAEGWLAEYPQLKRLKRSTTLSYEQIVRNHLLPAFGALQVGELTVERIERYVAGKQRGGLSAASCNRHLNVLSLILRRALRRKLIQTSPIPLVDRPKEEVRRWRILTPAEIGSVERALDVLIGEAECDRDRDDRQVVRVMFLTLVGTGVRRGELLGLRWRAVALADPDGQKLRIEETWTRHAVDTPKSRAGRRTIALGERLGNELCDHLARTPFKGDDERVFANPRTGGPFDANRYKDTLTLAFTRAGVDGCVRVCHDLRHTSISISAAAGTTPEALMSRAGHSSYSTTRRYIDLDGEAFRGDADRLEQRLWGGSVRKTGTKSEFSAPDQEPEGAANPQ
jgi:integrase